jgi:pyruvate dehydrogenase E2 component (dihydrolipoamide acetyltransferase)
MAVEIIIPKMGETTTEVRILHWLKAVGDEVRKGEPLLEVETDKATIEIESYADGTLERIIVPEGEIADAMQVVAILSSETEEGVVAPKVDKPVVSAVPGSRAEPTTPLGSTVQASPVARRLASDLGVNLSIIKGSGRKGLITAVDVRKAHAAGKASPPEVLRKPILASPKARSLAKEMGLDLNLIRGTGIDGMITTEDVQSASLATPLEDVGVGVRAFSKLRRTIATRMLASKQTTPHFYLMVDISMSQAEQIREECVKKLGWKQPPTYTDIIVRACALSLANMPEINIRYSEAGILERKTIDIGVAVGLEKGLIVPVLTHANQASLRETSEKIRAFTQRAHKGKLKETDLADKSMVVSNLGMQGIDAFVAIIDPPDAMILAVGRVADRVVAVDGEAVVQPICTLTLSIDHRVLDGVIGSRFLMCVKEHLENPVDILGE